MVIDHGVLPLIATLTPLYVVKQSEDKITQLLGLGQYAGFEFLI